MERDNNSAISSFFYLLDAIQILPDNDQAIHEQPNTTPGKSPLASNYIPVPSHHHDWQAGKQDTDFLPLCALNNPDTYSEPHHTEMP